MDEKKLKLVNLTPEQEQSRSVKFVFNTLPTTREAIDTLFSEELSTAEQALIGL